MANGCELPVGLVQDIINFIDVVVTRGAIRGPEISSVAILRETLTNAVQATQNPNVTILNPSGENK